MPVTYLEIDSDKRDSTLFTNPYTFDISTNTSPSTPDPGQLLGGTPTTRINTRLFEVRLLELTIPYLNNLSFFNQPYVYVKFENSRSIDNSHFYSNNPSSTGKFFRVPLNNVDIDQHCVFATFSSKMTQVINLSLQENLTFDVRLPNNLQITPIPTTLTTYLIFAALAGSTSVILQNPTDVLNFIVGNTMEFSISGTTYVIVSIDYTIGEIFFFPGLDAALTATDTIQNNTYTSSDRVTALFELTSLIPR